MSWETATNFKSQRHVAATRPHDARGYFERWAKSRGLRISDRGTILVDREMVTTAVERAHTITVNRHGHTGYKNRDESCLLVTCWCDTRLVSVPRDDVLAGVTRSCDSPWCYPGGKRPSPKVMTKIYRVTHERKKKAQ